jgi:hypothetical protein
MSLALFCGILDMSLALFCGILEMSLALFCGILDMSLALFCGILDTVTGQRIISTTRAFASSQPKTSNVQTSDQHPFSI